MTQQKEDLIREIRKMAKVIEGRCIVIIKNSLIAKEPKLVEPFERLILILAKIQGCYFQGMPTHYLNSILDSLNNLDVHSTAIRQSLEKDNAIKSDQWNTFEANSSQSLLTLLDAIAKSFAMTDISALISQIQEDLKAITLSRQELKDLHDTWSLENNSWYKLQLQKVESLATQYIEAKNAFDNLHSKAQTLLGDIGSKTYSIKFENEVKANSAKANQWMVASVIVAVFLAGFAAWAVWIVDGGLKAQQFGRQEITHRKMKGLPSLAALSF